MEILLQARLDVGNQYLSLVSQKLLCSVVSIAAYTVSNRLVSSKAKLMGFKHQSFSLQVAKVNHALICLRFVSDSYQPNSSATAAPSARKERNVNDTANHRH